ncbi:hypothetical protein Pst134EA_000443 [Puccinia striiformis f. sp. tritici]|uniref:hypothetical protein n=1 Tax=Puccinia striiformis f. sp. tritici TaxID=168172 RepID=UPI002007A9F3|nr:hypothetical protein Pst134EA_000443 [Puccinia striiformis f. sp. tritici]KAH9473370.1 hypothetical protein Pst134EA_000443 [Puccinia striiformis f. sp. tritici]
MPSSRETSSWLLPTLTNYHDTVSNTVSPTGPPLTPPVSWLPVGHSSNSVLMRNTRVLRNPRGDLVLTEANDEGPRPFKAFLDVGLRRTSTGARIFGAMKGASDGGIFVPHSENRFPGYDPEAKELDADMLKSYIYGGHVAEYMEALEEEDDERFKKQYSTYLADDIGSADIEEIYTEAHKAIRADPAPKPTDKSKLAEYKKASKQNKPSKIGKEQRAANVKAKVDAYMAASA